MDPSTTGELATAVASGRRRRVPRGEVQRQALLDAFARLLDHTPAMDISVKDITDTAGIKRPNFYFYFEAKGDVLGELVGYAWDDWAKTIGSYSRLAGESHGEYFDRVFGASHAAWVEHAQVMVAGMQAISYNDRLGTRWTNLVADLNEHLAEQMSRDADAGLITPLSEDHFGLITRLTDMIVVAFYKDRSIKFSDAESARMLASLKAIWVGVWGAPSEAV